MKVKTPRALLTDDDVREIKQSNEPSRKLAIRYEVAECTIQQLRAGRTWSHIVLGTAVNL